MEFSNVLNTTPVAAPDGYNGRVGSLDMTSAITFIKEESKIVVNDDNLMDLRRTLARCMWVKTGCPTVATVFTTDHINTAKVKLGQQIVKYNFYSLLHDFGIDVVLRNNDTVPADEWDDHVCSDAFNAGSDLLWGWLTEDDARIQEICAGADSYILLVVYNALHRAQSEGHNAFTAKSNEEGNPSFRLRDIAGAKRDEFNRYTALENSLHDMWHDLTNDSMEQVTDAITGLVPAIVEGPIEYAGTVYGADGGEVRLHELMKLSQSALDRWPLGNVGTAAMHVALSHVMTVMTSIRTKLTRLRKPYQKAILPGMTPQEQATVLTDNENALAEHEAEVRAEYANFPDVSELVTQVRAILNRDSMNRDDLLAIKEALMPVIGFTAGFITAYDGKDGEAKVAASKAFAEAAKQPAVEGDKAMGVAVGEYMAQVVADHTKISEMAATMIHGIANAMRAAVDAAPESDSDSDSDGDEGGDDGPSGPSIRPARGSRRSARGGAGGDGDSDDKGDKPRGKTYGRGTIGGQAGGSKLVPGYKSPAKKSTGGAKDQDAVSQAEEEEFARAVRDNADEFNVKNAKDSFKKRASDSVSMFRSGQNPEPKLSLGNHNYDGV